MAVETISVVISDSSDMLYFDLYLIYVFDKSTKAERCADIMFKLTLHCLSCAVEGLSLSWRYRHEDMHILDTHYFILLGSTLGAW